MMLMGRAVIRSESNGMSGISRHPSQKLAGSGGRVGSKRPPPATIRDGKTGSGCKPAAHKCLLTVKVFAMSVPSMANREWSASPLSLRPMPTIRHCRAGRTMLTSGKAREIFSSLQVRILNALASGVTVKRQLQDLVVGPTPTRNEQTIFSRSMRGLIQRGIMHKERVKVSLTPRGTKIYALLRQPDAPS